MSFDMWHSEMPERHHQVQSLNLRLVRNRQQGWFATQAGVGGILPKQGACITGLAGLQWRRLARCFLCRHLGSRPGHHLSIRTKLSLLVRSPSFRHGVVAFGAPAFLGEAAGVPGCRVVLASSRERSEFRSA